MMMLIGLVLRPPTEFDWIWEGMIVRFNELLSIAGCWSEFFSFYETNKQLLYPKDNYSPGAVW